MAAHSSCELTPSHILKAKLGVEKMHKPMGFARWRLEAMFRHAGHIGSW